MTKNEAIRVAKWTIWFYDTNLPPSECLKKARNIVPKIGLKFSKPRKRAISRAESKSGSEE